MFGSSARGHSRTLLEVETVIKAWPGRGVAGGRTQVASRPKQARVKILYRDRNDRKTSLKSSPKKNLRKSVDISKGLRNTELLLLSRSFNFVIHICFRTDVMNRLVAE